MTEHPNALLLRRLYDAFGEGELDVITGSLTEDFALHVVGRNPLAGDYAGKDGLLFFLGKSVVVVGDTLKIVLDAVLADDELAVAFERVTAHREGKSLDVQDVTVYRFRDGLIAEMTMVSTNPCVHDAFWS